MNINFPPSLLLAGCACFHNPAIPLTATATNNQPRFGAHCNPAHNRNVLITGGGGFVGGRRGNSTILPPALSPVPAK